MISIIHTGVANIRSLQAALDRLGLAWQLTADPNQISKAEHVILPGVGAFAAAMQTLEQHQLCQSIKDRIAADQPTLCICLGLQLLAEWSEESPGIPGLGIIPQQIQRFPPRVQIPQLGWNEVRPLESGSKGSFPFSAGEAYFANSFRLPNAPEGWGFAETDYGGPFVSSCWRGRLLACQFHPELSGSWGEALIHRWFQEGC
jgi:imidazole glycerol phosphate synthase glutamine amidotransferase subunit